MSSLSFALFGSNQLAAARQTLSSIRRHYPDSYIAIISDCGEDYSAVANEFGAEYFYYRRRLRYPTQPFGWRREGVLEFLERMYIACLRAKTTHIMYVEEDVLVFKPLEISDDAEIIGFKTCYPDGSRFPNGFPDAFLDMIRDFSGQESDVVGYGAQGGCVLNVATFVENYPKIVKFINDNLDYIQDNIYPTAGWIDCFLTWYYMLCGKSYTYNANYIEVNDSFDPITPPLHAELATHYQKFYTKNPMLQNLINQVRAREIKFQGKPEFLGHLNTDEHRGWWMNTKTDHYALLCWISDQLNNVTIYDVGTFRGMSALALASNPTNRVITYDNVDWSRERVRNPGNIDFIVGDFFNDSGLLKSPFIMFDVDPHNGIIEAQFLEWLERERYKGVVFFDDIHLNPAMQQIWDSITAEKHDLTEFGHYSGSGLVIYD